MSGGEPYRKLRDAFSLARRNNSMEVSVAASPASGHRRPPGAIRDGLRASLREHLKAAADEMEERVREQVPEYARVAVITYEKQVQRTIGFPVAHYINS